MRKGRPPRAAMESKIRETGGSMSRLAEALGVSRQTAYAWVYQLDLADVVGIRQTEEEKMAKPRSSRMVVAETPMVSVTTKLPAGLWKWVRIRAIDLDTSAAEILEAAVEAYRRGVQAEKP